MGQKYTSRGKAETGEREGKRRGESVRKRVRKRKIDREGEGRERGGGEKDIILPKLRRTELGKNCNR